MELVKPEVGTLFWMVIFFSAVIFILKKFAWKPILNTLRDREKTIEDALKSADIAKEEMVKLKADNEKILNEARIERDKLIKEARAIKDKIIQDAHEQAQQESKKMLDAVKQNIDNEKKSAINEIKSQIAVLSLSIAEKVIREKLDDNKQKELVENFMKDLKIN
jgi:F-type H+-transporting ATPase subunit b